MRITAKYRRQDHKTNKYILSELTIKPLMKKIQNYRNKWVENVWRVDGDRRTATFGCEICSMWETKPMTTPSGDFSSFNGTGTGHEA
jgi:hypothetical protein